VRTTGKVIAVEVREASSTRRISEKGEKIRSGSLGQNGGFSIYLPGEAPKSDRGGDQVQEKGGEREGRPRP